MPDEVKYNEAGNAQFEEQAYDEALTAYRQAQVAEPDLPEPYYNAANTYNRQGQVEGALAQTEQSLKTAEGPLAAQAWYNLGNAYFDAQQWEQAIAAYQEALRLTPDDADAKVNLELALQKLQEQQNQEEQNQEQQDQESENQEEQNQDQQDQEQQNQEEQNQEEQNQEQQNQESENQDGQEQPGEQQQAGDEQPMTPEQAAQLLRALLGDSQTLQEKLQEVYRAPGGAPEEDW
ncbi:MAG TPA: tetratricopeptide repeat protein [Anaerolineae bacterium]|nr:tetratricopeptide repeat protein [Anaerolineae bacterium]